ncbi:MAG: LysM peptidoglycan-binding domain-containing protein [Lachnospiraceae bacterium]|nr:LysM peptidoglycan-binding domain-containing protein [Lachnospiraceae bacterium]
MRQPSIVIHKGKKEDKYQLYVEDYVISFLKKETDQPGGMELNFYGCRDGRKYTVYGVGLDRHIADFDKYDLLEEIGCRLTQTDPVFLVKEEHSTYEIKGYDVFYCENQEMQDYLIYQPGFRISHAARGQTDAPAVQGGNFMNRERKRGDGANPHVALSLQLGLVFIVLVAIVINSSNSFEKMEQLNQSAKEVFFVMENQEAEGVPEKNKDITVERDEALRDDQVSDKIRQESEDRGAVLQDSVLQENALHVEAEQASEGAETVLAADEDTAVEAEAGETDAAEEKDADVVQEETVSEESGQERAQQDEQQDGNGENGEQADREAEEGVEALSRNVARYYEVERGDTLYVISQKIYGDTSHVKKICEVNQITNPDNIRYGQKIILP